MNYDYYNDEEQEEAEEVEEEEDIQEGVRIYPLRKADATSIRVISDRKTAAQKQKEEKERDHEGIFNSLFMPWFYRNEQRGELWAIFCPLGGGASLNFALPTTRKLAVRIVCGLPRGDETKRLIENNTGAQLLSTELSVRKTECCIDLPYEVVLVPKVEKVEEDDYLIVKMPLATGYLTWT